MGILIHTLELKLRPFEVTPYVCIGSHAFAMFSAHALREGRGYVEEVGHDAYLRRSHMTLVCNYAATRSKGHLRV